MHSILLFAIVLSKIFEQQSRVGYSIVVWKERPCCLHFSPWRQCRLPTPPSSLEWWPEGPVLLEPKMCSGHISRQHTFFDFSIKACLSDCALVLGWKEELKWVDCSFIRHAKYLSIRKYYRGKAFKGLKGNYPLNKSAVLQFCAFLLGWPRPVFLDSARLQGWLLKERELIKKWISVPQWDLNPQCLTCNSTL